LLDKRLQENRPLVSFPCFIGRILRHVVHTLLIEVMGIEF